MLPGPLPDGGCHELAADCFRSVSFIESNNKPGQIGDLVRNTLPAAFSSALSLALATQLTRLPCTEKQIFDLIKKRETRVEAKE